HLEVGLHGRVPPASTIATPLAPLCRNGRKRAPSAPPYAAGVPELEGFTGRTAQLRVAELHSPLLPRLDREDTRAQQAVPRQLDQRRVRPAAHDLLVDGARAVAVHHLAGSSCEPCQSEKPENAASPGSG